VNAIDNSYNWSTRVTLARILTTLVEPCAEHGGLVNASAVLLVALGMSNDRNIDFLEKIWVGLTPALKIPKAYHRKYLIGGWKL
jgi:hypothetical protein